MARIVLISLYDRNAYGLRLLSASLKRQGHECSLVFLKRYRHGSEGVLRTVPEDTAWVGIDRRGRPFRHAVGSEITDSELELLGELLLRARPDVVGLTVNSPLLWQARRVTDFIKSRFEAPVVWGGYHPTVDPLSSTSWCDYACVGEGDAAMLEIAACADEGRSLDEAPNLAFRRNGDLVTNPLAPLVEDLDALPPPDRDPNDTAFVEHDRLEAPYAGLNDKPPGILQALTSRGCPYHCTYCCEATFKSLYRGQRFLRRRSLESLVNELAEATLAMLLAVGGPYHLCINRLHVMPGTALGTRLAADGLQLPEAGAGGAFDYYARLFRIASLSRSSAALVALVQRVPWFRRHPRALDPLFVELLMLPLQPCKLLRWLKTALRHLRERFGPVPCPRTWTTEEASQ